MFIFCTVYIGIFASILTTIGTGGANLGRVCYFSTIIMFDEMTSVNHPCVSITFVFKGMDISRPTT